MLKRCIPRREEKKKCFTPPTPTKVHTLPSIKIIIYIYSSKLFEFFWSFTCVEKKSIQFLSLTHSINRYIIKKDETTIAKNKKCCTYLLNK